MKKELEYKYDLCLKSYQAIRDLPFLGHVPREQHLVSYYYDTIDLALAQQGYALRILKYEGQYIQTLKGGGKVEGALHEREEWQSVITSNQVEPKKVALTYIRQILEKAIEEQTLQQLFVTDFTRICWDITIDTTVIELAIDQGVIRKGTKTADIFELEIELISGELSVMNELCYSIEQAITLNAQAKSKAERAYAL